VDHEVSSFVLPVGATINMDGTSLYQAVAAVFITQALHFPLEFSDQLTIVLTALLASIGSAAVPGAGMVMLVIVLESIGIPADKLAIGLALIFAIDRPLDMCRTVVNVTGDAMVSVIVAHRLGKLQNINGKFFRKRNDEQVKNSLLITGCLLAVNAVSQETTDTEPDSTTLLNEVVVNAYQINTRLHQVPGSISVLSGEEIHTADGNNFANTLHAMPGIYMHSGTYATSRIVIRGVGSRTPYNTNRIKSYLNNIPITTSDGISTPEDIDLTGIGRMEVIKGPASALYGSGLGGSLNLFTPEST